MHATLTAVVDACVLCGPLKRQLVLGLAEAGLARVHWSAEILSETERTIDKIVARRGFEDSGARAARTVELIDRAFPEATVAGLARYDDAIGNIPDDGDRHVIAAALKANVDVIVTENLRDFPRKALSRHALQARSSDAFFAEAIDSNPRLACSAMHRLRQRIAGDRLSPELFISMLEKAKLRFTVERLRDAGFGSRQSDDLLAGAAHRW